MHILTFEELNNEFGIDNEPMSNISKTNIGKDIYLTLIEMVMRDQITIYY